MQYAARQEPRGSLELLKPRQTLEQQAYEAMRAALRDRFAPAERITASEAARQLGVSRMPVVQAFQRLIAEGFLTMEPHKGVRVADPTPAAVRERYLTLIALESLCATESLRVAPDELARDMRRQLRPSSGTDSESDQAFHQLLWRRSELPEVAAHLAVLWERGTYYRVLLFQDSRYHRSRTAEHEAMVTAAESGDRDQLVDALTKHRMAGLERMLEVIARQHGRP
jgi:DNA-binding GntR family transcriptional regulator